MTQYASWTVGCTVLGAQIFRCWLLKVIAEESEKKSKNGGKSERVRVVIVFFIRLFQSNAFFPPFLLHICVFHFVHEMRYILCKYKSFVCINKIKNIWIFLFFPPSPVSHFVQWVMFWLPRRIFFWISTNNDEKWRWKSHHHRIPSIAKLN